MLTPARVVATYPSQRRIDVVTLNNGVRIGGVMIAAGVLSSDAGSWNVPDTSGVSPTAAAQLSTDGSRNMVALIAQMVGGGWVAMGFLHPNGGQMSFTEQDRTIERHVTGAYTTIAPDGSIEAWHPSGAYFRIGTGAHEPLASIAGSTWKDPPTADPPTLTLSTPKFNMTVDPAGSATMTFTSMLMNGPVTVDGTLTVEKLETGQDGLSVTGNVTATGTVTGQSDVVGGGKSLKNHVHSGVQSGSSDTGPPV